MKGLSGALLRYRIMAWVTGVVLAALTIWLVVGYGFLNYAGDTAKPSMYRYLWMAHGWLYIIYFIVGIDLCFRVKYSVPKTLGVLASGTIPFASFFVEHFVNKDLRSRFPDQFVR